MTRARRVGLATLFALSVCAVGYWALMASVHSSATFLGVVQWVALPAFSALGSMDHDFGEAVYWSSIFLSGALWWLIAFALFSLGAKRGARA